MIVMSNCSDPAILSVYNISHYAPVAQLDRVTGFEPVGREFESLRACQTQV